MQQRPIIILDTETSGLNPEAGHEVVQIVAQTLSAASLDDHPSGRFVSYIKPQTPEKASPEALSVIGPIWEKSQKEGIEPKIAFGKFLQYIDSINPTKAFNKKPILIGHNINFDLKFLNYSLQKYGLTKLNERGDLDLPWLYTFDSMAFMFLLFEGDSSVMNLKLDSYLGRLGLSRASQTKHDAIEDVDLLAQAVRRSLQFARKCNQRMKVMNVSQGR